MVKRKRRALAAGLVSGTGLPFLGLSIIHFQEGGSHELFTAGPPTIFSLLLVLAGLWLYRSDFTARDIFEVYLWCLGGGLLLGTVALSILFYQETLRGVPLMDIEFLLSSNFLGGATTGSVGGYFYVQSRRGLESRMQFLRNLLEIARLSITERELDDFFEAVQDELMGMMDCDAVSVLTLREGEMRFRACRGLSEDYVEATEGHSPWEPGVGEPSPILVGDAASSGELEPEIRGEVVEEGIGALAFFPITYRGELLGKFMVYFDQPHEFGEDEVDLGKAVGDYLGLSINNKRAEEERERQRQELEVLNRLIRHDIKNDMNLAVSWERELEGHVEGERGREVLERLQEVSRHVVKLTEATGDLLGSIVEGSGETGSRNLKEDLEMVVEKERSAFPEAEIELMERVPDLEVEADEMFQSVISNLVGNAVKHNDKEVPEVQVGVEEREESVVLSVADNGPGIDDQGKEEIFGKGRKGPGSPGTGIGLHLVESLVEGYGGEVWIEDNEPEGSVFKVRLRKANRGD